MTRRLSQREHVLLFLALVVAVATGIYIPRVRPARLHLEAVNAQRASVDEQIRQAKWPKTVEDPERLGARKEALRTEVAAAREALQRAERRFVSRCDHALADELRVRISALADRHGVYFRENLSCPEAALRGFVGDILKASETPDAARLVQFLALGDPYTLSARQVTLETDFAGLRGFLRDINRLDHRVLVIRFDITVGEGSGPGVTPLLATLVFMF